MPGKNCVDLAKKLIECFNKNDANNLDYFDGLIDKNVKYHDLHTIAKPRDFNTFKQKESEYITAFPNKKVTVDQVFQAGENRVVVCWTTNATHKGNYHGVAPTNKEIKVSGMTIWQFQNDKVVEAWQVWDRLGLLEQIGAIHAHK
jgi:steroid delta-isomerase-like uncharacterized protein